MNYMRLDGFVFSTTASVSARRRARHERRADFARVDRADSVPRRAIRHPPGRLHEAAINTVTRVERISSSASFYHLF